MMAGFRDIAFEDFSAFSHNLAEHFSGIVESGFFGRRATVTFCKKLVDLLFGNQNGRLATSRFPFLGNGNARKTQI